MKTYQDIRNKHLRDLGRSSSGGFAVFGLVIVFAVSVILLSLWNTASMQEVSTTNAKEYVNELTVQIAGTVSTDVSDKKTDLSSIAESLRLHFDDGIDATSTDDYLDSHLGTLFKQTKFDFLIFQHADAQILQFGDLSESLASALSDTHPAVVEAENKGECIAYIDGDIVMYVTPVYSHGEIVGTLIAGSSGSSLNDLMKSHIYQSQSSFCLANREGKLLIESGDSHFVELSNLLDLKSDEYGLTASSLESDFNNGINGVVEVKLSDGNNYLMTYAPIEGEDWMIVTLIPTNTFSKAYIAYMKRALSFTIGTAVIFVILLVLLVFSYRGARKKLEYLAYTDELTGGINGTDFEMRYDVMRRKADPLEYSIVMLDINDFKLVNELGGFDAGDTLLKYVYSAIMQTLDGKFYECACRVEVDHYFICFHENTPEGIQARIDKIAELVNSAGESMTQGLHVTFGLGACIIDDANLDTNEAMQRARIAKRSATSKDRNQVVMYNEDLRHAISQKVQLDYMAEESIKNGDFVVYYQPKVSARTGRVKGAEALVRWMHPNRGLIPPDEFVPVLEESGRITEVDHCVFEMTCRYLAARKEQGKPLFTISVNLSRLHFWKDNLVEDFAAMADKYGIDHRYLEFEITETLFMEQDKLEKIKSVIQEMHEAGFTIALDDFGVGYSSLSLVNEMDVDTLKFDRSFFMNLGDERSRKVVTGLIQMGSSLNLDMVIEGIEDQDQIDFIKATRADIIQGYYFSKPLCEADFETWLSDKSVM